MKTGNVILEKTYAFALKIIILYKMLAYEKNEYVIARQILRCGTSIGANIEEGIGGQSKRDFISKLSISYKEARETKYWLRLLRDSRFIDENIANNYINDCDEILKILCSILNTTKSQLRIKN